MQYKIGKSLAINAENDFIERIDLIENELNHEKNEELF